MNQRSLGDQDELLWACPVCGPVQPLALPSGRLIRRSCACQRAAKILAEQEEKKQVWRDKQMRKTFGGIFASTSAKTTMVTEMRQRTFANFHIQRDLEAYQLCYEFAKNPRGNLLLYGSYGTGKTHLEAAICNLLREEQKRSSLFLSVPELFLWYEEARKGDKVESMQIMEQLCSVYLLILDDVDKVRPTESRHSTLFLIVDARYKARLPIVMSTNRVEELGIYLGEAALSRFSRGLTTVPMYAEDMRYEESLSL